MDTLQAAILLPKLTLLEEEIQCRQKVADWYGELFGQFEVGGIPVIDSCNNSAWAQYTMRFSFREKVQEKLRVAEIPYSVHYPTPLNKQPAVADLDVQLENGDLMAAQVLSLPMHPYLSKTQVERVVNSICGE